MAATTQSSSAAPASEAMGDAGASVDPSDRQAQAQAVIRRNVLWAIGAGVLPTPIVDVAAVTAIQVKQIRQISEVYGQEFSSSLAKKIIYSLLGSVGVVGIGSLLGASFAKFVPLLGTTLGIVSVPVLTGAFTHATGQVLIMHFEAGGTLLNFDSAAMRNYFKQEFEKAKETVSQLRNSDAEKAAAKPA